MHAHNLHTFILCLRHQKLQLWKLTESVQQYYTARRVWRLLISLLHIRDIVARKPFIGFQKIRMLFYNSTQRIRNNAKRLNNWDRNTNETHHGFNYCLITIFHIDDLIVCPVELSGLDWRKIIKYLQASKHGCSVRTWLQRKITAITPSILCQIITEHAYIIPVSNYSALWQLSNLNGSQLLNYI